MELTKDNYHRVGVVILGSARVSRAGLKAWTSLRIRCSGVAPKRPFFTPHN